MASKSDMDTYGCSICLEILFEPITMPCNHKMCKLCFAKNLELTNLHCPFCKKRIGTWARKAKNLDNLVDKPLWTFIQENYDTELQNRIKGNATTLFEEGGWTHEFTFEDGVIGKEFAEQIQAIRAEEEQKRTKELLESQKLIEAIQLEEAIENPEANSEFLNMQKKLEAEIEQRKKDEELARKLSQEELISSPSTSRIILTRNSPRNSPRTSKTLLGSASKRCKGPRQMTLEETMKHGCKKRKIDEGP